MKSRTERSCRASIRRTKRTSNGTKIGPPVAEPAVVAVACASSAAWLFDNEDFPLLLAKTRRTWRQTRRRQIRRATPQGHCPDASRRTGGNWPSLCAGGKDRRDSPSSASVRHPMNLTEPRGRLPFVRYLERAASL